MRGGKSNGEYILMGSHVDAWGKSAICNASGDALNLEIARICYENRAEMKRDVEFVLWDGHEIAEGGGSTWYADRYWQDMTENCVGYLNLDNLAIQGTTVPGVEGQPEMKDLLTEAIQAIFGEEGEWHQAYKGGGRFFLLRRRCTIRILCDGVYGGKAERTELRILQPLAAHTE